MSKFTEWLPHYRQPVRRGVYQTKCDDLPGCVFYNWWNGSRWASGGWNDPKEAAKRKRDSQNDPVDFWRGLKVSNVEVTGAARLYRAASVWTAGCAPSTGAM
jgi:hypothetical protein